MPLKDLISFNFNGQAALREIIITSKYGSLEQGVASLTIFAHPKTVAQARHRNIFQIIRASRNEKRGAFIEVPKHGLVMLDDNKGPTDAFIWAHNIARSDICDIQFCHIWRESRNVVLYTNLANICILPAFLSKLSDSHRRIQALLRYRAFRLYDGWKPHTCEEPSPPDGYDQLDWAAPLPVVSNLEAKYRKAMETKGKDRTRISAREIGWVFSEYQPDSAL